MNKTAKTVLIILAVLLLAGAAAGGFLALRHRNRYISKTEAIAIAREDAGLAANEILESGADFESNRLSAWYEVELESRTAEYEYDIDAITGQILFSSSEPRR